MGARYVAMARQSCAVSPRGTPAVAAHRGAFARGSPVRRAGKEAEPQAAGRRARAKRAQQLRSSSTWRSRALRKGNHSPSRRTCVCRRRSSSGGSSRSCLSSVSASLRSIRFEKRWMPCAPWPPRDLLLCRAHARRSPIVARCRTRAGVRAVGPGAHPPPRRTVAGPSETRRPVGARASERREMPANARRHRCCLVRPGATRASRS